MTYNAIGFIAPSTCLARGERSQLRSTVRLLKQGLGASRVYLSPHLFSCDEDIDHVTAPAEERARVFKMAVREMDLIVSVAGGTGAEDLIGRLDASDFRAIRGRRPLFIGFSDFTFLLDEIYYRTRVPVVYFPSLKLGMGNFRKMLDLVTGGEIRYQGKAWLTRPPVRKISGIPIGGNLTTFVNFLNRTRPPRFSWRKHVLFIEDIQVDVEDLHRLLSALSRHEVFRTIRGVVVGSLIPEGRNSHARERQKRALRFVRLFLREVIRERRKAGQPLPILAVNNFGHEIRRNLMAVPIGGHVTISRDKQVAFRLTP